jgi:carbon storage regulator
MLVLTRLAGESIIIDGGIVVTVLSIAGGKIQLGIEAPKKTRIVREELTKKESDQ